jgi:hypothetical protein
MLKFKEYLQKEELTVGYHNDGAGPFNTSTGAYASSDQTGSETFPPRSTHLASTDLVIQGLPNNKIEGKIFKVQHAPNGACTLYLWTPQGGSTRHRIDYESLKKMPGFTRLEDMVKKRISLTTQGHDPHGNLQVRYGQIS